MRKIKSFFSSHPVIAWNGVGIFLGILSESIIIWLVFFVVSLALRAKRIKRLEAEKKVAAIKEAELYITGIKERKQLPRVSAPSIFLTQGEYVFLKENVSLKETRAVRKSTGGFGGLRVAKGITIGGWSGSSESHQEWRLLDSGDIILTNKKIVFRGEKENRTIPIDKIMALDVFANGKEIAVEDKIKGIAFPVKNPYIWKIAISILRNAKNPLDLSGVDFDIKLLQ